MSDPDVPRFRVANEGEPVPPVDPEDLKRRVEDQACRQGSFDCGAEAGSR
jgi:hypothetical protein